MPYHVRVLLKADDGYNHVKLDLSREQLERQFLEPYRRAESILMKGHLVPFKDIARIIVTETSESSEQLIAQIRAKQARGELDRGLPDEWLAAKIGQDVTDELIEAGIANKQSSGDTNSASSIKDVRAVFVIHGRDRAARDALFAFLRAIGLHPIEWSEAVLETGKASPYIGDVLDAAFNKAQAIVVLMTPDDEARLNERFCESGDPEYERTLTGQARPNVLFEAGMAMGRDAARTVIVELGTLRPFSDLAGRHFIRLNNSTQRRQELAQRLLAAGCPVTLTGTDWHTIGNFAAT